MTIYFHVLNGYKRFCCIRYTGSTHSAYYRVLPSQTHTNLVSDYITINYTCMTHRVGIYQGAVVLYRNLTRITINDLKSEWMCHQVSRNDIRRKDTGLTGAMHYDIFRLNTQFQTVLLHSIHCQYEFHILQDIISVDTC